jgi:hypothetical protein
VFCWPVFTGKVMLPADLCLLMLPWKSLQSQFPDFHRAYNPMLDPIQQYLPWRIYAVESLRSGFIPLWNPYSFCGTPFLANLQSTVLYPPNLLFLLTGARHGFGVSAILHLTLGGLFMYWFLLDLRLRYGAALLGALVFMFNGFTVTWLEYPTLSLWVLMWLPAVLLCYQRSLARPFSPWPALCALAIGVQFLGGHLQISAYLVMAFLLYALVRMATPGQTWRQRGSAALLAALALALGLGLALGQILPTLELAAHTGRVSHGVEGAISTAFPLTHLVLYLIPNFFGNPVHYNYWGSIGDLPINYFETACYVGILPLFLGVCALQRWREPKVWFFGGLTVIAMLAALGTPAYAALYYLAPGFKELAGLGRILCLAAFGLAGLAAMGIDELASLREPVAPPRGVWGRPLMRAVIGGIPAVVAMQLYRPLIDAAVARMPEYCGTQAGIAVALGAATLVTVSLRARLRMSARAFTTLALVLVVADLFWFGIRFNPYTDARMAYPETETTRWLQEHAGHQRVTSLASDGMDWMAHNSSMILGLRDIHGSDSLRVKRSFDLVSPPDGNQSKYPPADSPLLDALAVRYLVTEQPPSDDWVPAPSGPPNVYLNNHATDRVHMAGRITPATDPEAITALRQGLPHRWDEALASPEVAAAIQPRIVEGVFREMGSPTRIVADEPNRMTVQVDAESDRLLVVMDSHYPGWRAWVDGKPETIYRVNYGFRGVLVPEGRHIVEMRYQPASYRVGLFLSLLALSVMTGFGFASLLASRASASTTAGRR